MAASVLLTVPMPVSPEAGCTPSSGQNSPESAASPASRHNDLTTTISQHLHHNHEKRKKKPYKELTLEEKVRLIKMAEENNCMSQASIAERYSIAKSNVCRILQRKHEYLRAYESAGFAGTRKRKLRNDNNTTTTTTTMVLTNNMKSKREINERKQQNETNGSFILKPIPRKVEIKNEDENKRITVATKEAAKDSCQSFMNPADALINQLRNGSNDHKSAFRNLKPSIENPNLYDASFITSQLLMSIPSLSYVDDSAMLQAKTMANPAFNLFLNHALSKQIEFLNDKLAQYEQKQLKVRNFIQNAENAGLARSSDAQQLMHSLMSLL